MKIKKSDKPGKVVMELAPRDERLLKAADREAVISLKRILVPVDFSDCSLKALQYAIPFARQFDAGLILLHVVPVNYAIGEYTAVDLPVLEKELVEESEGRLRQLMEQRVGGAVPAQAVVRSGLPHHEIVEAARALEADLILLSTHGRTGLKHVLLGSTAENVVRHAPCPVLTVREQEHEFITPQS